MKAAQLKKYLETVDDETDILAAPIIWMKSAGTLGKQPDPPPEETETRIVSPFEMYPVIMAVQMGDVPVTKMQFVLGYDAEASKSIEDDEGNGGAVH